MQINSIQKTAANFQPVFTSSVAASKSETETPAYKTDYVLYYIEHYNYQKINNFLAAKTEKNTKELEEKMSAFSAHKGQLNFKYRMHDPEIEDVRDFAQNNLLDKAVKDYKKAQGIVNESVKEYGTQYAPTLKLARILNKANFEKSSTRSKRTKNVNIDGQIYKLEYSCTPVSRYEYLRIENTDTQTITFFKRKNKSEGENENPFGYIMDKVETPEFLINTHWLNEGTITSITRKNETGRFGLAYKGTYNLTNALRPNITYVYPISVLSKKAPELYYFQYNKSNPGQLELITSDNLADVTGKKIAYYSGEEQYYLDKTHPLLHEGEWGYFQM